MQTIKTFFRNICHIIDKYIVTPITKLIYLISSKYSKSGKQIENWLSTSNTLLFVSLFLAFALFVMIDKKIIVFNDNSAEVLQNQPVSVIYNDESYVVEGLPETVDITLIGSKTDLYIAKQSSSHDVTIDLSGLKPGTHKVSIKYNRNTGNIDYMVNPSTVTVIIYQKVSETKTLDVDILNEDKMDSKLVVEDVNYDTDKVIIKGAEHTLNEVATVKALVDLDNLTSQSVGTNKITDVPLRAYDKNGNVVDVEIVPSKIDVDVTISSPSAEIPLKIVPTGDVSFGLGISSISLSEESVTVYAPSDVLEKLNETGYIPISVDVSDLKSDKEYKLEVPLPVGAKSLSTNTVTVKVSVEESTSKDFENIVIHADNLASGYRPVVGESDATVTVTVKGVKSVIDSLKESDIYAYIDLDGYTKGTYKVDVKVKGSDLKLQYTSKVKQIEVQIIEKK
jgi:YbbR domain-containing protein